MHCHRQSYEIKSPPWTIWWFRILGIFSVENIDRLGTMMFQTSDDSQLCIDSQHSSQQLTIFWSLMHHSAQPILIFFHLDRLKEGTWLHGFGHRQWLSRLLTLKELTLGQSHPSTCLYSASKKNTDLLLIQMTLPFLFKNLIQQLTYIPLGWSKVLQKD